MTQKKFSHLERILEPQIVSAEQGDVEVKTPISQSVNFDHLKSNYAENFFRLRSEITPIVYRKREFLSCASIVNWALKNEAEILSIKNGIDSFGSPIIVFHFAFPTQNEFQKFQAGFDENVIASCRNSS